MHELLEAGVLDKARSRAAEIVVNHGDRHEATAPPRPGQLALGILRDLALGRLVNIDNGAAAEVIMRDLRMRHARLAGPSEPVAPELPSVAQFLLLVTQMPRSSSAPVIALLLFTAPHIATANSTFGSNPMPPISGNLSLFRSPIPRISPGPPTGRPLGIQGGTGGTQSAALATSVGAGCRAALSAAEKRYGIPTGLLQAIGLVESGRRDETTGKRESWPWAINAEGESHFFDTKEQAVGWVRQAQNRGIRSIDVGCGQINLVHHPTAFSTMEKAFDPTANADYAARFLKELRDTSAAGNWMTAVGFYHSQTPELAEPYRRQVQAALASGGGQTAAVDVPAAASETSSPFGANRRTQLAAPLRAEPARVMQVAPPVAGRSLDEYRATPIRLARVIGTAGFRTQE